MILFSIIIIIVVVVVVVVIVIVIIIISFFLFYSDCSFVSIKVITLCAKLKFIWVFSEALCYCSGTDFS